MKQIKNKSSSGPAHANTIILLLMQTQNLKIIFDNFLLLLFIQTGNQALHYHWPQLTLLMPIPSAPAKFQALMTLLFPAFAHSLDQLE